MTLRARHETNSLAASASPAAAAAAPPPLTTKAFAQEGISATVRLVGTALEMAATIPCAPKRTDPPAVFTSRSTPKALARDSTGGRRSRFLLMPPLERAEAANIPLRL